MRISGGRVFDLNEGFVGRTLCTDGGLIAAESGDELEIDASGCLVIPGLVDIHFHGCVGEDLSDGTAEGLQRMADYELSQGVTGICPAGMTLPESELEKLCRTAAAHRRQSRGGAELVGIHLEGPFLSSAKKGAQNGAFLHRPDVAMLRRLNEAAEGCVRLVTVAPEEPGGMELIRAASADGITVSVGHTTADYDTAAAAFAAGATHATHLFNGMPPLHHRKPSVVGAAFDNENVRVELICDGVHLHESVIRAAFRLFGRERVIIISDSLRATGMPDGRYSLGGQEIEVRGKLATLADAPDTIAGSVTSLMGCLRHAVSVGIPPADAVRAASYNPACAVKIDDRVGSLDIGKEASIVLLDERDLSVRSVIFKGRPV